MVTQSLAKSKSPLGPKGDRGVEGAEVTIRSGKGWGRGWCWVNETESLAGQLQLRSEMTKPLAKAKNINYAPPARGVLEVGLAG